MVHDTFAVDHLYRRTIDRRLRIPAGHGALPIEAMRVYSCLALLQMLCIAGVSRADVTVARIWDEQLLHAISVDTARPTVHARNLFHLSAAMYDAWAAYDATASQYFHHEKLSAADVESARNEAI